MLGCTPQNRAADDTTLVLNAATFTGLKVPNGVQRVALEVEVAGRKVTATIAAKTVRKMVTTLAEHGAERVAIVLQGALEADDTLSAAGLSAMVKPKA